MSILPKLLLLHVRTYDFKDDSGRRVTGANALFLDPDCQHNAESWGQEPMKMPVSPEIVKVFSVAPAVYQVEIGAKKGAGGKAVPTVVDAEYVANVFLGVDDLVKPDAKASRPAVPAGAA